MEERSCQTTPQSNLPDGTNSAITERVRIAASMVTMVAIPLTTLLDQMFGGRWFVGLMASASLGFVFFLWQNISAGIRRTSAILVLVTAGVLPWTASPMQSLVDGLRIGCLIGSLLITVSLLSRAALRVRRVRELVNSLYQLPQRHRYLGLTLGSQFFGGFLGLAGIAMMMEVGEHQEQIEQGDRATAFTAIGRGYAALSLWSPMYSNMSIVLAIYKGPNWVDVLPVALTVSALLVALGAALEKIGRRAGQMAVHEPVRESRPLRGGFSVIVAMLLFLAFMVMTSQILRLPISAVIITAAPMAAWILNISFAQPDRNESRIAAGVHALGKDLRNSQVMAGEVMLFLASGCAGTVIAGAIPSSWTAVIGGAFGGSPILGSLFLSSFIVLLSFTAIHPMLSAVLVASSFGPQVMGLPVMAHLCAILVGWGLAIIITPFSVLSLMASRHSGIPILTISLRANIGFALLSILGSGLVLGGLTHLKQF